MAALRHYMGVARAPFLVLSVTLVAVGAAAAALEGRVSPLRTLLALVGLVAMHVAVNALNEAGDMRSGIDLVTERTPFSGGSGVLPSGALQARQAYILGLGSATVGAAIGGWFLAQVGWVLVPILAGGAFIVLGYTELLARTGVGELAAGLGLGALPVIGTALVQEGRLGPAAIAASVPAFLMTFDLLLLNEFPDEKADRRGGRVNLVLMLGRPAAARVYLTSALLVPASVAAGVGFDLLPAWALLALLPSILLAGPARWALRTPREPVPVPALGANVRWILTTNTLLAAGLLLSALRA